MAVSEQLCRLPLVPRMRSETIWTARGWNGLGALSVQRSMCRRVSEDDGAPAWMDVVSVGVSAGVPFARGLRGFGVAGIGVACFMIGMLWHVARLRLICRAFSPRISLFREPGASRQAGMCRAFGPFFGAAALPLGVWPFSLWLRC